MRESARLWAVLAVAYAAAAQTIHLLWTNRFDQSPAMLANTVAVPAAQLGFLSVLALATRTSLGDYGQRFGLGGFFVAWLPVAVAMGATTLAIGYLAFSLIDARAIVVTELLFVPAAQSAALVLATSRGFRMPRWHDIVRHPLAGPVLMLDVLVLPAGWIWPAHPLIGLANAAVLQRRWMGTKFLVAAAVLAIAAFTQPRALTHSRSTVIAALCLAAVGLDGFVAWIVTSAGWVPAPLSNQPLTLIWIEAYGVFAVLFIWSTLAFARAIEAHSSDAAGLVRAGTIALFVSLLALMMNGFLSWVPIHPWAGLSLTLASLAGTSFCLGSLVLSAPPSTARSI
jgi:hypothetical protein